MLDFVQRGVHCDVATREIESRHVLCTIPRIVNEPRDEIKVDAQVNNGIVQLVLTPGEAVSQATMKFNDLVGTVILNAARTNAVIEQSLAAQLVFPVQQSTVHVWGKLLAMLMCWSTGMHCAVLRLPESLGKGDGHAQRTIRTRTRIGSKLIRGGSTQGRVFI